MAPLHSAAVYGFKERPNLLAQRPPDASAMGEYGEKWFEALDFKEWGLVTETNVASVFFVTMAFLSLLEESTKDGHGDASIINISAAGPHMSLSFGNASVEFVCVLIDFTKAESLVPVSDPEGSAHASHQGPRDRARAPSGPRPRKRHCSWCFPV